MTEEQSCNNCYNILKKYGLNCPKYCDYNTAKIALKNLYLKHHPDKGGDPEIFKEIRECGPMVVQDKCTDTYNIRTKCDIMTQKLRKTYTVKPTCIKYRSPKNKDTKLSDCSSGSYKRKGYVVQEKCKIFSLEEKKAADDYALKQQQKKKKQEDKLEQLSYAAYSYDGEIINYPYQAKVIYIYNKQFPSKSDFYLLNYDHIWEKRYEEYLKLGYWSILRKLSVKQQKKYNEDQQKIYEEKKKRTEQYEKLVCLYNYYDDGIIFYGYKYKDLWEYNGDPYSSDFVTDTNDEDAFLVTRIYDKPFPSKSEFNLLKNYMDVYDYTADYTSSLNNRKFVNMYEKALDSYKKNGYYNIR